jgi:hypothetical protein
VGTTGPAGLDLSKNFIAEILDMKSVLFGQNVNSAKAVQWPQSCEHAFAAVDDPFWCCQRPVSNRHSYLIIVNSGIKP